MRGSRTSAGARAPGARRVGGGSAATEPRLRPLGAPRAARVEVDADGTPVRVVVGRKTKEVCAVRERWRIDDEWWRAPLSRDYVTVVLQDGRPLTLYHDLHGGGWWVQGEES